MLLNKTTNIKITKKNINHYSRYFDNLKLKDIIEIDILKHLQKNSNQRFDVKCDICGTERNIKYQSYYKNINSSNKYKIYTCDKCSHIKLKETNLRKYGVEYYSKHEDRNDKVIKTSLERYGVSHFSKSDQFKEKVSKTNLEKFGYENPFMDVERIRSKFNDKYGVDHPSKVPEIYERIKKSNLETTGFESPLSSPKIREKIKITNIKRYGGHPMSNDTILNKMKSTNLERYGYDYILSIPENIENIKKYNLMKYGVENIMMSESVRSNFVISNHQGYIKYIGSNYSLFNCELGHEFTINIDNFHSRLKSNIPLCTVCNPIGDSQSIKEKELFIFIKSLYNGDIIQSYRDGLEIDVYLPDLKIGFEFNGLYWHSEEHKDKNYHINKTKHFKERGIRIIHIWEDDWDNKRSILESQISNWVGLTKNKIFARKCVVKEITNSKVSSKFLEENHIQGKVNSCLKLGLYYNDELVSLMTFDHFEGRKKMGDGGWNLNRFCNKLNTSIIGGASKLFKHFIINYDTKRVVSYADIDWSQGSLYNKLGFDEVNRSNPDYKYIFNGVRIHKSRFRKDKLNTNLSESKYMKKSHIQRIWDCGKIKFQIVNI